MQKKQADIVMVYHTRGNPHKPGEPCKVCDCKISVRTSDKELWNPEQDMQINDKEKTS